MTRDELLQRLASLRSARAGTTRVPHKPLLLLWLFGRLAATGSSAVTYAEAEQPVNDLINDFGPPVTRRSTARERAAMPFVHLERELWELRDATGSRLGTDIPRRRRWLLDRGAVGRLTQEVEQLLLTDPGTLTAAARLLLDLHFTEPLARLICAAVDLDLPAIQATAVPATPHAKRRRRPGFNAEVLRVYAFQCAMCEFDGRLDRDPVALEAAHVRWHSQDGPDDLTNALALCVLHHTLLDLGVLGLTTDLRIQVSSLYVASSAAGQTVHDLAGRSLLKPQAPWQPAVAPVYIEWHSRQVFKAGAAAAAP